MSIVTEGELDQSKKKILNILVSGMLYNLKNYGEPQGSSVFCRLYLLMFTIINIKKEIFKVYIN